MGKNPLIENGAGPRGPEDTPKLNSENVPPERKGDEKSRSQNSKEGAKQKGGFAPHLRGL